MKFFTLGSLLITLFISCEAIEPQGTRTTNPICGETQYDLCINSYKWKLTYDIINAPNQLRLKIMDQIFFDDCSNDDIDLFTITRNTNPLILETSNSALPVPGVDYLKIEISDCSGNIIEKTSNARYTEDKFNKIININI
jgi:hypothetical protein